MYTNVKRSIRIAKFLIAKSSASVRILKNIRLGFLSISLNMNLIKLHIRITIKPCGFERGKAKKA